MKLIHSNGYNEEEKRYHKEIICANIIQSTRNLIGALHTLNIKLENSGNEKYIKYVLGSNLTASSTGLPNELSMAVRMLWRDEGVKKCFARSREYQLDDSAK